MAMAPNAEATPAWVGTMILGMLIARAITQACIAPAPPKLASTKSRGSRPRSISTSLIAWAIFSQQIEMIASAASSVDKLILSPRRAITRSAATLSSISLPPSVGSSRPSTRLASVIVAALPPRW